MIPLRGHLQHYAWGKFGSSSAIFDLVDNASPEQPLAELWFGTHPSGPSATPQGALLSDILRSNPEYSSGQFSDGNLPFLLKAHPDKALAAKLHARDPVNYKDDNHKPEMTVALTDFEGLCGFRSYQDLSEQLQSVPELKEIVGDTLPPFLQANTPEVQRETFKALFRRLMETPADVISSKVQQLVQRLSGSPAPLHQLAIRLNEQYPGDVGIFNIFLLNYVTLKPGEGMFLAANEPHAYISGDVVEIMATSDNVVRAGLTPKFKDVETLISMLTYTFGKPLTLSGEAVGQQTNYTPPIEEFKLAKFNIDSGKTLTINPGPCLLLQLKGTSECSGLGARPGSAFFVPVGISVGVQATSDCEVWIAKTNDRSALM